MTNIIMVAYKRPFKQAFYLKAVRFRVIQLPYETDDTDDTAAKTHYSLWRKQTSPLP